MRPNEQILRRDFLWYLTNDEKWWIRSGSAQPFVKARESFDRVVSIPPPAEQDRIVQAIDEHLTRLDAAVATLERVRANLKRYRTSVLKAAVEGRLVPTEAELARREGRSYEPTSIANRQPRTTVRTSARRRAGRLWGAGSIPEMTDEEKSRLPEGWVWAKVSEVGFNPEEAVQVGPMSMRSSDFSATGVPVLNVGTVQWDSIDESKLNYLPRPKAAAFARYKIRAGDVLFTRSGTVGRCAIATDRQDGWLMTFHLLRVRTDSVVCLPEYLRIVLEGAEHVRRQTQGGAVGTTRAGFNTRLLANLDVPLPSTTEQKRIVARVQAELSVVGELQQVLAGNARRCDRLRQSVLSWAFSGKLVDQDPNDEPASVLLERIKAGRAASAAGKAPSPSQPRRPKITTAGKTKPKKKSPRKARR